MSKWKSEGSGSWKPVNDAAKIKQVERDKRDDRKLRLKSVIVDVSPPIKDMVKKVVTKAGVS